MVELELEPTKPESLASLDNASAERLFHAHRDELSKFLLGVLRDRESVADALQATFAVLLEKGGSVEPSARRAWLFRVSFNQAMLTHRNSKAQQKALERVAWEATVPQPTPLDEALQAEKRERVGRALEKLSSDQRDLVKKRIYEGKTFAEIARETGVPLGTLLSRMQAALKKLNQIMQPE